ncbi:MAG TPA: trigger factor [Treponemataceae bacterium]|nr:trigger factor [Treponemataceae bacterium]
MKITKEVTALANSSVKLSVTIAKEDTEQSYKETLAKYAKSVQIPGFRKGKVPVPVLERKYGEALKADVAAEIIDNALQQIFAEFDEQKSDNRPLAYSQPQMDKAPELEFDKDFSFEITYDVMPKVTVSDFSGITIKEPQVKIGDDEMKEELEAIRERNALVVDKKDADKAVKGDIATINYSELNDKGEVEAGSEREGFVFTIGSGQNIYKIDDEIIGMKKGDSKDITKTYAADDEDKELAGKTKKIRVSVTALKVRNLPELDDELAQDVNEKYKTLDDLKADIKNNMVTALDNRLREIKSNDLIEQLIERNPIELPKSMVEAELESRWRMMAQKFQTSVEELDKLIKASGQKKEDMLNQWSGDSEKMLKGRIIVESLLKEANISVTPEEVEAEFEKIAAGAGISVDEVKKHYADPHRKEYLIDDMKEQKLYADLFTKVKITKGEKTAFADLFKNAQ